MNSSGFGQHPAYEPWQISLSDRLSSLQGAQYRVLYFYELPDSASFRYRCHNMAEALNEYAPDVRATYIFLSDMKALSDPSDFADVLVVARTRYDTHVERLIASFRNRGKKVFFDIDDLIFDTAHAPLVASNLNFDLWGEGLDKWFSLISRIGATLQLCDEVITTNAYLSRLASEFSGLPAQVIPNFLNNQQLAVSQELFAKRGGSHETETSFRMGYFSGSKSHKKDFDVIANSLAEVMEKNNHVHFLLVGHLELPDNLKAFGDRLEVVGFTDFLSLQELISRVDLCLTPLQESIFTYSKSQLKFFEAGIVGVPTMATATPVFAEAITHNHNGYLVETHDWVAQISMLIEKGKETSDHVGREARRSALGIFTPEKVVTSILSVVTN